MPNDLFPPDQLPKSCPLPDEWPEGLSFKNGTRTLLQGVDVFYDFDWLTVIGHERSTFLRGKKLAGLVKGQCPEGKRPAILLTIREGFRGQVRETDTHYIVIISIHEYQTHDGNVALSFMSAGVELSTLAACQSLENDPASLKILMDRNLTVERIQEWCGANDEPARVLSGLLSKQFESAEQEQIFHSFLETLRTAALTPEQVQALTDVVVNHSNLSELLHGLAKRAGELKRLNLTGRSDNADRIVAAALRVSHRRAALAELDRLIATDALEKQFQKLLDQNWWMLGSHYVRRLERRHLTPEDTVDITLQSADHYFDLIELKLSSTSIFKVDHDRLIVGSEVNNAVNQSARYVVELERARDTTTVKYKADLFRLKVKVIIGHISESDPKAEEKWEALRMYNSILHGVQVMTYDELRRIAALVVESNEGEIDFASHMEEEREESETEAPADNSELRELIEAEFSGPSQIPADASITE